MFPENQADRCPAESEETGVNSAPHRLKDPALKGRIARKLMALEDSIVKIKELLAQVERTDIKVERQKILKKLRLMFETTSNMIAENVRNFRNIKDPQGRFESSTTSQSAYVLIISDDEDESENGL
ncbi:hypothetical protein B0H14DRAFT_2565583 [Mycena olivaceomarginata]|nr:hypothetical protein B0H14DRAFT_2565583 [Mycena olivaceomarginata]